jgi:hypothetical protein
MCSTLAIDFLLESMHNIISENVIHIKSEVVK